MLKINNYSREWEDKSQMGRRHVQKTFLTKDCHPKYMKNSWSSTVRKQREPLKNGPKDLNIHQRRYTEGK